MASGRGGGRAARTHPCLVHCTVDTRRFAPAYESGNAGDPCWNVVLVLHPGGGIRVAPWKRLGSSAAAPGLAQESRNTAALSYRNTRTWCSDGVRRAWNWHTNSL